MSENGLTVKKEDYLAVTQSSDIAELIKPLTNEIHLFDSFIAGASNLKDTSVLGEIKPGDKLSLKREQTKFDDNAIGLYTENGKKVGFIPEKDNVIFARLMDAGKLLCAKIKSIEIKGAFTQISIQIYLVDF